MSAIPANDGVHDQSGDPQAHLAHAERMAAMARRLCDGVIRVPAGERSAEFAERIEQLCEELEEHAPESNVPWYYDDPRTSRLAGRWRGRSAHERDELSDFNPMMPPLKVHVEGDRVAGTVVAGPAFTGPPGLVHGGTQAKILDHMLGLLVASTGRAAVTARLEVDFRRGAPIETELTLAARIERVTDRKVWVEGEILLAGELCTRGGALFVALRP